MRQTETVQYHYRGQIERGTSYDWRDGYSANNENGLVLYPWSTMRECQHEAKLQGKKAIFLRDGKEIVTQRRARRKPMAQWARVLILTLFMLGALAASAHAASVAPSLLDAPKPHVDRIQWSLFAAHAGFRALDVYSTHQAISRGYREIVLPRAIGEHTGPMIAYSAGTVAADYFAARYLIRHHHPTMAKVLTSIDIAQDAPWAIHNLMLKKVGPR